MTLQGLVSIHPPWVLWNSFSSSETPMVLPRGTGAVTQQQAAAAAAALGMQAPLPGGQNGDSSGASGALANSMPATAAMNAAAGKNSNLFEGNPNLKSLVNEQPQQQQGGQRAANQNLINRLPSSGTIFPDSVSNPSLSHLLQGGAPAGAAANNAMSNNRLSSMISLSSYLSREPSLVDLLLASQPGGGGQYNPALAAAAAGMSAPPPNQGGDDCEAFRKCAHVNTNKSRCNELYG